jgi:peroxiredoxin
MTTPAWKPTILAGDPAPTFFQRTPANPRYAFDTAAGRYIVLCFFGSALDTQTSAALAAVLARTDLFDDERACFFGVSNDPTDEAEARVANRVPGFRFFWDFDLAVAKLYGAVPPEVQPGAGPVGLARFWVVLDPTLRVIANIPFQTDGGDLAQVLTLVAALPPPERFAGIELQAPVLYLPRVFEPELCRHLIGLYETHGGQESGFMREVDGRTVGVSDPSHKRRKDYDITDKNLVSSLQARFLRRVVPEIAKAHQFTVTSQPHLDALRRYPRVLARADHGADDLVQGALLRAYERRATFREGADLRVWLMTILHNHFIDQLRRALLALPADQREALHLKAVEGLNVAEAAAVLQIPAGTVMSRVGRARAGPRLFEDVPAAKSEPARLRFLLGRDDP